ncbi:hypothetical protein C8N43_2613 [Litoreibacter ponti]|uniref:Concanavalin A-like lectin/glucanase superfamily protein n=2 Tax=Litoreibacter ponti TaxID=1510457 RepID=A0A2T6BPC2_9RHOB|nr:hypothetical protein C8N43_2613 [Litoreibacter ponti]
MVALTEITLDPFTRDKTLFDSGAAFGRDSADVTISGTGTVGESVQYRVLRDDGSISDWADLVDIAPDGTWTGSIQHARSPVWVRPEVRIKSETSTRALSPTRFGVGHVIALWGQSEIVRIRSLANDLIPAEPILTDDMVQAMWYDGTPVVSHITNETPHSAALAAMANVFLAERPNDKVALVFQATSGTGFRQLVDDTDSGRSWADDAALHAFATADGQHVGVPAVSWFATPGSLSDSYDDALFPLFTGKMLDGTPVNFPTSIDYGSGFSFQADHWFGELYDPAHTRWVPYGPHRFEIGEDMQSATITATGATQNNLENKQSAREAWREMVANPNAGTWFLPLGAEPLGYRNGVSDGMGGWTDQSHPSGDTDDGAALFARLSAHAILQSMGLTSWSVPEFDNCEWEPSGSHVDVWSSAGPITTSREVRGEAALDDSFAHWTDVLGWQINGTPAERAELVSGRIRLYPASGTFLPEDTISFGEGGATGMVKFPEDFYAECYKNIPLVDVGAARVDGIAVRPMPAPSVLQNALVVTETSFDVSAAGPYFVDPAQIGAGWSQLQFSVDVAVVMPSSGARTLITTTGNYLRLEVLPNGKLRLRLRDADGDVKVDGAQTASGTVIDGVRTKIDLAFDLVSGLARIWSDGALVLDQNFTPGSGILPSNRVISMLAVFGGTYQVEGTVYGADLWRDSTTDGTSPAGAPHKTLRGPAASINLDLWKDGADAT